MSAPGKGDATKERLLTDRIKTLAIDGYVIPDGRAGWHLTMKGWSVLFAEAEPRMFKPHKGKKI